MVCLLIAGPHRLTAQHRPATFRVDEATIADLRTALRVHRATARQLVEAYPARIDAYDKPGRKQRSTNRVRGWFPGDHRSRGIRA